LAESRVKNKQIFTKERVRGEKGFVLSILIQSQKYIKTQIQTGITFNVNIEMGLKILKYNKALELIFCELKNVCLYVNNLKLLNVGFN
jgi:hypothetical protein